MTRNLTLVTFLLLTTLALGSCGAAPTGLVDQLAGQNGQQVNNGNSPDDDGTPDQGSGDAPGTRGSDDSDDDSNGRDRDDDNSGRG